MRQCRVYDDVCERGILVEFTADIGQGLFDFRECFVGAGGGGEEGGGVGAFEGVDCDGGFGALGGG